MAQTSTLPATDSIYAFKGTTTFVRGERGTVVEVYYNRLGLDARVAGCFVLLDERPAMIHVTFGDRVTVCTCGAVALGHDRHHDQCNTNFPVERSGHYEVLDHREVTRDEFDEITGLAKARRDMGWTL